MFNLRSPLFADRRAREALTLMYDFEWANRVLFHGGYGRSVSYFQNTPLAAREAPDARELELLRDLPPGLPPEALTRAFKPAVSDGSGRDRRLLERDYNTLMLYGRLLDRALQWQYLGVPGNIEESRKLAVWDRFGWPARPPDFGYGMEYWWSRKTAAAGAEIR
jgi:microcin C transport system substrate-binding protein